MIEDKNTCNQCGHQMDNELLVDNQFTGFCCNPECPNYALLQISLEDMPEDKK